jgi:FkbM family methyltransferase
LLSLKIIDVKAFFMSAVKCLQPDCLFDIGSRDGDQSLLLRDLRPGAYVGAFEANPDNYQKILAKNLDQRDIHVFPYAVSNENGTATFYIVDPDAYPGAHGSSSLTVGESDIIQKTIMVQTKRLDDFVLEHVPDARKIALWVDVENAEYSVLEGIEKIKDRVILVHTETSITPSKENQKLLGEVTTLMNSYGFILCGRGFTDYPTGDVVFISEKARAAMGFSYHICVMRAFVYRYLPINQIAAMLKRNFPAVHRILRRIYLKIAS